MEEQFAKQVIAVLKTADIELIFEVKEGNWKNTLWRNRNTYAVQMQNFKTGLDAWWTLPLEDIAMICQLEPMQEKINSLGKEV